MELLDSHSHVNFPDFDQDRDQVLARAREAGVLGSLEVATDPETWQRCLDLAEGRGEQRVALGIHPHHADTCGAASLKELRVLLERHAGQGGGPRRGGPGLLPGLLPARNPARRLSGPTGLAAELNLPLILHCRQPRMNSAPRSNGRPAPGSTLARGLALLNAGPAHRQRALALGLHLGFGGVVTYPKAEGTPRRRPGHPGRPAPPGDRRALSAAPTLAGAAQRTGPPGRDGRAPGPGARLHARGLAQQTTANARNSFGTWS